MSKILRCKKCGDIIQSKHTHDMVWCKCHSIAIDGGDDYCRLTGDLDDMEFLVVENKFTEQNLNNMYEAYLKILNEKDKEIKQLQDQLAQRIEDAELIAKSNSGLANMVTKKDHQIAILDKALEMACKSVNDKYAKPFGNDVDYTDYFIEQAKEMINGE